MTIHTKPLYRFLTALGLIATLAACGSGGDDDNKDSTPDSFTIAPITDAAVNTEVTSSSVTLAGFNQDVSISITGGSYSIAGGAFITTAGTVSSGKSIAVKVTTSTATNTAVEAVLTVGGVTGNFKVTTKPDVTPNAFSFTAATGAVPKSVNTSTAITVVGIDIAVPISIIGGEYSVNDAAFTSTAGTVAKNQTVKVRGTAAATTTTSSNVELSIGGVKAAYAITTLADTVAPTAQILFPPPVSMTEGNTILVRGSASDDYNTITSVKVNGVAATTTDGFKNWQALVPLADAIAPATKPTENTIKVVAEDSAGNKSDDAAHVSIRQDYIYASFPESSGSGNSISGYPGIMVLDKSNGNNRLLLSNQNNRIVSIDLNTSKRTLFTDMSLKPGCLLAGIAINASNNHLYASCYDKEIYEFDLLDSSELKMHSSPLYKGVFGMLWDVVNGVTTLTTISYDDGAIITADQSVANQTVLSDAAKSIPNALNPINHSQLGIAYDKKRNRYLVSDISQQTIFAVDALSGERTIFSNNLIGTGEHYGPVDSADGEAGLAGVAIDDVNQRVIVTDALSGNLFAVDLITFNRTVISSNTSDNPFNKLLQNYFITIVDPNGYAFLTDYKTHGIYAIDLVTGHRVVFSKD